MTIAETGRRNRRERRDKKEEKKRERKRREFHFEEGVFVRGRRRNIFVLSFHKFAYCK